MKTIRLIYSNDELVIIHCAYVDGKWKREWGIHLVAPNIILSVRFAQHESYCHRDKIICCESLKSGNIFRKNDDGGGGTASRSSRFLPR